MSNLPPISALICGIPGAVLITNPSQGWQLVGIGLVMYAIVALFFWGLDKLKELIADLVVIFDRNGSLARELSGMSKEALDAYNRATTLGMQIDFEGNLTIKGTNAPKAFMALFLSKSSDYYLVPVGTWGEGSKQREWAQEITAALVLARAATPAVGRFPARWTDDKNRKSIAAAMGLRLANPSPSDPGFIAFETKRA